MGLRLRLSSVGSMVMARSLLCLLTQWLLGSDFVRLPTGGLLRSWAESQDDLRG